MGMPEIMFCRIRMFMWSLGFLHDPDTSNLSSRFELLVSFGLGCWWVSCLVMMPNMESNPQRARLQDNQQKISCLFLKLHHRFLDGIISCGFSCM